MHERPIHIGACAKLGHWELDLIESARDARYLTSLIERISSYTLTKYIKYY